MSNCNYILFTKWPWPGDSECTLRFLSQAVTCLPHSLETSHFSFNCWTSNRETVNINFYGLWLDQTGNRTLVYHSVANALSARPLSKRHRKDLLGLSSQAATCPFVYQSRWRLQIFPLIAERFWFLVWPNHELNSSFKYRFSSRRLNPLTADRSPFHVALFDNN